jgi:hypothetical protein
MRRKTAAMSATQLAEHFLHGPGEVTRRVHAASAADAGLLEILQNDHRVVMERLDNLIAAGGRDLAAMRADFLEMKCWLEAHSLAEERVLYARLKAREETAPLILAAAFADHEMVARTLENMGSLDLNAKQWMTRFSRSRRSCSTTASSRTWAGRCNSKKRASFRSWPERAWPKPSSVLRRGALDWSRRPRCGDCARAPEGCRCLPPDRSRPVRVS